MGRNKQDFTHGRFGGGTSNEANWINENPRTPPKPIKGGPDIDMPDYADYYEEKHT